jgi:hypothetical protein
MTLKCRICFWVPLLFGITLVTWAYARLQVSRTIVTNQSHQIDLNTISEKDKMYIDQYVDRVKWLESIAYASIVGLLVLQSKSSATMENPWFCVGASLLVVSLYSGFLSHDVVLLSLTRGIPLLYSAVGRVPQDCQFWSMALALVFLAGKLVPTYGTKATKAAALAAVLWLSLTGTAHAQPDGPQPFPQTTCTNNWIASRFGQLNESQKQKEPALVDDLQVILNGVAANTTVNASNISNCNFATVTLDRIRYGATITSGNTTYDSLALFVTSLKSDYQGNHLSHSAFFDNIASLSELWHKPSATLVVNDSVSGDRVTLDHVNIGFTSLMSLCPPGSHQLDVFRNGANVLSQSISVADGDQIVKTIP